MDFFQNGEIATLHALGDRPDVELMADVAGWAAHRPVTLVLPTLASELDGDALPVMVKELAQIPYLAEVVVGLDQADADDVAGARAFFSPLDAPVRIVWNDGPRLRAIEDELLGDGVIAEATGKGRNVWWCLGYALGTGRAGAVALHDADVVTYDHSMLTRLLYPVLHPTFGYAFAKGYYFRADDHRLNGRVARLCVTPLLRSLRATLGGNDYVDYLDSFRYPLAGEFAVRGEALPGIRIPADWGLEIGVLGEVYRNCRPQQICQVDIAGAFDHKHQDVSADDASAGLHKMVVDIAKAVFRRLANDGEVLSAEHFRTLRATYQRLALEFVDRYHDDAVMNGYTYDRHAEIETVEVFARAVARAGDEFMTDPLDSPFLPNWARVEDSVPDIHERIIAAVDADHAG